MRAHERVAAFVAWKGWTQAETAKQFGCHQTMISKVLRGKRKPGRVLAQSIENVTKGYPKGGAIRVAEWDAQAAEAA